MVLIFMVRALALARRAKCVLCRSWVTNGHRGVDLARRAPSSSLLSRCGSSRRSLSACSGAHARRERRARQTSRTSFAMMRSERIRARMFSRIDRWQMCSRPGCAVRMRGVLAIDVASCQTSCRSTPRSPSGTRRDGWRLRQVRMHRCVVINSAGASMIYAVTLKRSVLAQTKRPRGGRSAWLFDNERGVPGERQNLGRAELRRASVSSDDRVSSAHR
jgi:hypothetical protein